MMKGALAYGQLLKAAAVKWYEDRAQRLGAALAFYTVLALPPLFVIIFFMAGLWFNASSAREQVFQQINELVGEQGGKALQAVTATPKQQTQGVVATSIAVVTLLLTAAGLFLELQDDLDTIWGVEIKPEHSVRGFIIGRLLSFALIFIVGFLLFGSLVASTALAAVGKHFSGLIPGNAVLVQAANEALSFGMITVLFALIFKMLPDVKIAWRDVWVGAAISSALFTVGKLLLGVYLGHSTKISAYGAAGSVVVLLLWMYYSAQILFYGAELTQVYACRYGRRMEPASYAQWIKGKTPVSASPAEEERWPVRLEHQREVVRSVSEQVGSWHALRHKTG